MLDRKKIISFINIETDTISELIELIDGLHQIGEFYSENYKPFIDFYMKLPSVDQSNVLDMFKEEKEIALEFIHNNNPESYHGINSASILLSTNGYFDDLVNYIKSDYPLDFDGQDARFKTIEKSLLYGFDFLFFNNDNIKQQEQEKKTFINIIDLLITKGRLNVLNDKNEEMLLFLINESMYDNDFMYLTNKINMDLSSAKKNFIHHISMKMDASNQVELLTKCLKNNALLFHDETPEKVKSKNLSPKFSIANFAHFMCNNKRKAEDVKEEVLCDFYITLAHRLYENKELNPEDLKENNFLYHFDQSDSKLVNKIFESLSEKEQVFFLGEDLLFRHIKDDSEGENLVGTELLNLPYYTMDKIDYHFKVILGTSDDFIINSFISAILNRKKDFDSENSFLKEYVIGNHNRILSGLEKNKTEWSNISISKLQQLVLRTSLNKEEPLFIKNNKKRL